ncbi:MAG TPA: flagellar export chaperone FlgN [Solirubrobacterales bacterium]|nr:flagellar export chaperone FlgN [Solirubrobacterales bacterium]
MNAEVLVQDQILPAAVARHLDLQIASAQRLLDLVLRQGAAIRERDVEAVLARLADIQVEMAARESLEHERTELIRRAAVRLEVEPVAVGLPALASLAAPTEQDRLLRRSAELRGLLAEIAREHGINRALMRQELTFLDHLLRVSGEESQPGGRRLMDVEA